MSSWDAALDQFEARLEEFRSVLTSDGQPAKGLWPPAEVIGVPLPPELAERATDLLAKASELEAQLVARRSELPARRTTTVRHRPRRTSTIYTHL